MDWKNRTVKMKSKGREVEGEEWQRVENRMKKNREREKEREKWSKREKETMK